MLDPRFSGPLSECFVRNDIIPGSSAAKDFEYRWLRGQMRGWALKWRAAGIIAAVVRDTPADVAELCIGLAVSYRESAARELAKKGGAK
jgi:hypothetical protein